LLDISDKIKEDKKTKKPTIPKNRYVLNPASIFPLSLLSCLPLFLYYVLCVGFDS